MKGRWMHIERVGPDESIIVLECSNCGKRTFIHEPPTVEREDLEPLWKDLEYCPNCNADMRTEEYIAEVERKRQGSGIKTLRIIELGDNMVDVDIDGVTYKNVRMRQPFPDDKDMHDIFLLLTDKTKDGRWELVFEPKECDTCKYNEDTRGIYNRICDECSCGSNWEKAT